MKLLLTSGGVTNDSIRNALVQLLEKPIAECTALCIPTAMYGHPAVGPGTRAWEFISGNSTNPMIDLGWKSVLTEATRRLELLPEDATTPAVRDISNLSPEARKALAGLRAANPSEQLNIQPGTESRFDRLPRSGHSVPPNRHGKGR